MQRDQICELGGLPVGRLERALCGRGPGGRVALFFVSGFGGGCFSGGCQRGGRGGCRGRRRSRGRRRLEASQLFGLAGAPFFFAQPFCAQLPLSSFFFLELCGERDVGERGVGERDVGERGCGKRGCASNCLWRLRLRLQHQFSFFDCKVKQRLEVGRRDFATGGRPPQRVDNRGRGRQALPQLLELPRRAGRRQAPLRLGVDRVDAGPPPQEGSHANGPPVARVEEPRRDLQSRKS